MKFSRGATVLSAAVVLVGGGAGAVFALAASPNDTVTLCVNTSTTSVSAPTRSGNCASGQLVTLPTKAAFDLLKNRVSTLESEVSDQNTQGAALQSQIDALQAQDNQQSSFNSGMQTRLTSAEQSVADLKQRVSALETNDQKQDDQIAALDPGQLTITADTNPGGGNFKATITGSHLDPGSAVFEKFPNVVGVNWAGNVASDGTFSYVLTWDCSGLPVTILATTALNRPIQAALTSAGCP